MATYKFECNSCSSLEIFNISMQEYVQLSQENAFDKMPCKNCGELSEFSRIFNVSSSKIERDKEEMMRQIKEDSRKIVQGIKSGNAKIIRNIYGEE